MKLRSFKNHQRSSTRLACHFTSSEAISNKVHIHNEFAKMVLNLPQIEPQSSAGIIDLWSKNYIHWNTGVS